MRPITYAEVEDYRKQVERDLKQILKDLDDTMVEGRDSFKIPIYLTKTRIKSADSIFLKTKRDKISDLTRITDYAGMRILTLFEQDLFPVHYYIISKLKSHDYKLIRFRLFNWPQENDDSLEDGLFYDTKAFVDSTASKYPEVEGENKPHPKGYKSIHYIFKCHMKGQDYYVEVQLRTLLQDVWGELEHSLSYKQGIVHPHITKSFALLAKDLENSDKLLSHLKQISQLEKEGHLYALKKAGPAKWFAYDDIELPEVFRSGELGKAFTEYKSFMMGVKDPSVNRDENVCEATKLYETFRDAKLSDVPGISIRFTDDRTLKYITAMEEAYIEFWKGNYPDALRKYRSMQPNYDDHYILHFRIGEIYFIMGENEKALDAFDKSEACVGNHKYTIDEQVEIKFKLAYIYWLLGADYIDYSIDKLLEVKKVIEFGGAVVADDHIRKYTNNSCAYHLDRYIYRKRGLVDGDPEEEFSIALENFIQLRARIDNDKDVTSNMLDTAAWFLYNSYLKDRRTEDLDGAEKYCQRIGERENKSTLQMTSFNIQKNHIQKIMCAKIMSAK